MGLLKPETEAGCGLLQPEGPSAGKSDSAKDVALCTQTANGELSYLKGCAVRGGQQEPGGGRPGYQGGGFPFGNWRCACLVALFVAGCVCWSHAAMINGGPGYLLTEQSKSAS